MEDLRFRLEGNLDLHAFLGLSEKIRPGYEAIRATATVKTDAPKEQIADLWAYVQKTSPVFDILSNPVPVILTVES